MSAKPWEDCPEVPWVSPREPDAPPLVGVGGNLDPPMLLRAYTEGIFPWFSEGDPLYWWSPEPRAIFDVDAGMYVSKRLARTIRAGKFQITYDRDFEGVMRACGESRDEGTWVTVEMLKAYADLHRLGYAHSVEAWADGELVGGVYGVAIHGFFAAESMFHRHTDASKVALAALFDRLSDRGYVLLDTQMLTEHTESLGGFNIHRQTYLDLLDHALEYEDVTFG